MMMMKAFLAAGQTILGRSSNRRFADEDVRWRAMFGASPEVILELWDRIEPPESEKPQYLLWALMLLKVYATEPVLCALAGGVNEKTFRKHAWKFIEEISNLEGELILWDRRLVPSTTNICKVSVDGTDFMVQEPHPFSKEYYSHKFKRAGLRYEVAVSIEGGDIVWINGPFKAGKYPDITIFRRDLKMMLAPGESVIADNGYRGEDEVIVHPGQLTCQSIDWVADLAFAINQVSGRHETVNGRFKNWGALRNLFRHDHGRHGAVFRSIVCIEQININRGGKLFKNATKYQEPRLEYEYYK